MFLSVLMTFLCLFFQVKDLTKFLDPSGLGVISFEDFHRGISAISSGGEFLANPVSGNGGITLGGRGSFGCQIHDTDPVFI